MAQLDELYYFDFYDNPTLYAANRIKTCKIYEEWTSDSIPQKLLIGEKRFDPNGRLYYDRVYYMTDTLEGILKTHVYDSLGRVSQTLWTWIEDKETDRYTYTYNKNGLLTKYVMDKQNEPNTKYKKVETKKLFYNKEDRLLYIKTQPRITTSVWYKSKTYYEYRNDTTFIRNSTDDYYYTYVKGLLVEHHFAGNVYSYEYDEMQHLVKFTKMGAWDVIEEAEHIYENGFLVMSNEIVYRYDGTIHKRRTYVYERY